ncbi:hypothetical protein HDF26_002102 [Pedobacter cryoconitis]|uniref:Uncharacterized protein n=1 Tax=Pedobacter cryoconitis TaxID=188932 RepID=A0A7W8ZJI9_9SPHI|nr:hypothetical protein [Pedobacter cryoconitis]MBB5635172.1 hypothetical protein [Pedobacter cryoconitis]MBB6271645.1 hypothetical protein [Pedobacter cryoconitis]
MATTYPYTQSSPLVNSITATTVVSLSNGMQVAQIAFTTAAGQLGQITLSPVQPTAENVEFKAGTQTLKIKKATFSAAFGFDPGQVTVEGDATDQNGKNDTDFQKQIASWSN